MVGEMSDAKMPEREMGDGSVEVKRLDNGRFNLSVVTDGGYQEVQLGAFNAWRAFGLLAFMLGIPLPKKLQRAIKLTDGKVES